MVLFVQGRLSASINILFEAINVQRIIFPIGQTLRAEVPAATRSKLLSTSPRQVSRRLYLILLPRLHLIRRFSHSIVVIMAPQQTCKSVHLAKRPDNHIESDTFTIKESPVPDASTLKDGEVIFASNYLSLDPAMRGWLNDTRSYIPPVKIGAVMRGNGVGKIIASKSSKFYVGETVSAMCGWSEIAVLKDNQVEKLDLPSNATMTDSLGALGMTGLTAYVCWKLNIHECLTNACSSVFLTLEKSSQGTSWSFLELLVPQDPLLVRSPR
jgi:hypothetical protein